MNGQQNPSPLLLQPISIWRVTWVQRSWLLQRRWKGIVTVCVRGGVRPEWCQQEWTQEVILMDWKWETRERDESRIPGFSGLSNLIDGTIFWERKVEGTQLAVDTITVWYSPCASVPTPHPPFNWKLLKGSKLDLLFEPPPPTAPSI